MEEIQMPEGPVERKKRRIIDAIDDLFGDTSVSQQETLDALEDAASDLESKIYALRDDIKNKQE